jgi:hypothetical protein
MNLHGYGLTPSEVRYLKELAGKVVQAILLILVLLWLAPHLWNVYGLRPESCVDWANSNPTISYVEAYDCETPVPFVPFP